MKKVKYCIIFAIVKKFAGFPEIILIEPIAAVPPEYILNKNTLINSL